MDNTINKFQDLENKSILLNINGKNFFGTFNIKNQDLFININMTNDIEEWRRTCKNIKCICAKFIKDNRKITLLNCAFRGHSSIGYDPILNACAIFSIDRVLLDYDLDNYDEKFITSVSVEYEDITWFTNEKVYNNDIIDNKVSITLFDKEYKLKDKTILFNIFPSFTENTNFIKVGGKEKFTFVFNNKQNIEDALHYIYLIRNLLMLLGKRNINVIIQEINDDFQMYKLIDCTIDKNVKIENKDLVDHLNHRNGFKIENMESFSSIVAKFEKLYKRLNPLLELYYNVVKYNVPILTRFVNALTMLENYSREFDDDGALALTITKTEKKPRNGANFVDRVKSLIENVNSVYNLSDIEIDMLSKKIKSARTYYIHYENRGLKIEENILFKYVYFIEDIIILNIYLLLEIDINKINNVSYNDYYYNVKELL